MTNDELLQRLREGMPLCPHEHEAWRVDLGSGQIRYGLDCDGEPVAEIILGNAEEPAPYFERWNQQHNLNVTRAHLRRVLEGREDTPSWRQSVEDRLALLEGQIRGTISL